MPQGTPGSESASENGEPHAVPDRERVLDAHFAANTDAAAVVLSSIQTRLSAADGSSVDLVRTASGVFETADQIASNNSVNTAVAASGLGSSGVQFVPLLKSEFDEVRGSLHRVVENVNEPLTRVALGLLIHDQISLARRKIAENPIQFDSIIDDIFERVDQQAYSLLSNLPVVIDDYSQIEGLLPAFLEVAAKHYDDAVQLVIKMERKVGTSLGVFQKFLLNILGTIGKRFPVWIDTTALGNRINAFLSSNDLHRDDKPSFDAYCRHHREEEGRYKGAKILFMTYASLWESMMPSIADRKMMDWLFARIEIAHKKLSETIDSMDFKKKDKLKELWQQNLTYIRSSFDEALKDAKTIDLPLQLISIASSVPSPVSSSAPSTKERDYSLALTKSSIIAGCDIAFLEVERIIRQSIPDQNRAGEVTKELRAYLFGTVLPQLPEHINQMNFPSLEPLMDLALGVRPFLHAAGLEKYADRVQEKSGTGSLQAFELMGRDTEAAVAEACAMFLRPLLEVTDRKLEIETIDLKDFLRIAARTFDAIGPHLDFNSVDPLDRAIADKLRQSGIRNFVQLTRDIDQFLQLFLKDNLARINPMIAAKLLDVYDAVHQVQIEEFTSIFPENGRKAMQVFSERKTQSAIELEDAFPKQEDALKEEEVAQSQTSTKEAEQSLLSSISKEDLKVICDAVLEEVADGLKRFYPNWKGNRDYESTLEIARTSVKDILAECPETLDRNSWNKMEHLIDSAFDFAPFLSGLYVSLSAQQKILEDDNTVNVSSRGAELAFKESELVTHAFLVLLQNLQERLRIPTISADQLRHFFAETRLCKPHEAGSPAPSATRVKLARFVSRMLAALPGRIDRLMAQKIADTIARAEEVDAGAMPDMPPTLLRTFNDVDQTRHALDKQSLDHLFRTVMFLNEGADAKKNAEQLPETRSMPRAEFERLCHQMGDEIFAALSDRYTLDPTVFDPYSIRSSVDLILKQCPEVITQENYGELFDFFNYSMPYGILLRKVGLHRNLQKRITPITNEDPDKRLLFCEEQFQQKTREILNVIQQKCAVPTISKEVFKKTLGEFALTQPRAQMAKNLDRNVYKLADFINLFLADLPEELDRRTMSHFISVLYKTEIVGIDLIAENRDDLHAALNEKLKEAEKRAMTQIDALLQPPKLKEEAPSMTRTEFETLCTQIVTDVFKKVKPAIRTIPIGHPSLLREFANAFLRGCPERMSRDNFDALDALHEGAVPYPALLEAAGIPEDVREKIIGLKIKPYDAGAKEVAQARFLETTMSRAAQLIWETVIRRCRVPTIGKLDFQNELPVTFTLARPASEQSMGLDTTFHRLAHFATGLLSALPERIDRKLLSRLLDVLANAEEVAIDLMTEDPEMRDTMRAALQESKQKAFVQMDALLESAGPSEVTPPVPRTEIEALVADINRRLANSSQKLSKGQDSLAANNGLVQIILSHVLAECPQEVTAENFQNMVTLRYSICRIPVGFQDTGVSVEHQQEILGGDRVQIDYSTGKDLEIVPEMTAELGTLHRLLCERLGVSTISAHQFRSAFHPILFGVPEAGSNEYYGRLSRFVSNVFAGLPERLDRHMVQDIVSAIRRADDLSKKFLPPASDKLLQQLRNTEKTLRDFDDTVIEKLFTGAASGTPVPSNAHDKPAEKTIEDTSDPETWSTDATLSREVSQDLGVALWNCPLFTRDLLKRKIGDIFSSIFAGDIDRRLGILTKAQRRTELQVVVPLRDAAQRVVSHVTQSGSVQTSESYRMLIGGLGAIIKNCRGAHLRIALTEYLAEAFNTTLDGLERMVLDWKAKQGDEGSGNGDADAGNEAASAEEQDPGVPETLLKHRQILDALINANEEAGKVLGVDIRIRKDTSLAAIESSCPDVILSIAHFSNILYANVGRLAYLRSTIQGDDANERFTRIQTIFERSMRSLVQHFPDAPDASVLLHSLEYLSQIATQSSAQVDSDIVSSKCDEVFSVKIGGKITRGILPNALPVAIHAMEEFVEQTRLLLQQFIHSHLSHGLRSIGELHMLTEFLGSRILHGAISSEASNQLSMQLSKSDRKTLLREFTARLLNRWNSMAHAMFDSVMNPPSEPEVVEEAIDAAQTDETSSETQDSLSATDSDDADRDDEETSVDVDSIAEVAEEFAVDEPTPKPEPIDPLAEAIIASGSTHAGDHIGILFDTSLSIHSEALLRGMVHQHSMKDTEVIAAETERVSDVCHNAIAIAIAEMTQVGQMPSLAVLQAIAGRAFDLVTTASHDGFVHLGAEQRDALIKEVCESLARPDISAEELLIDVTADTEISEPEKSADASEIADEIPPTQLYKKGIQGAARQFVDQRVRAEKRYELDRALKQLQVIDEERPSLEAAIAQAFDQLRQSAAGGDITASDTLANFQAIQRTVLQMLLSKLPLR